MKQFFQPYGLTENKTETLSQSIITKLQLPARSSQEPDWLQSDISQIKLESALSINYKETEYWSLSAQSNWFTNRCWKCFSPPAHCNMSVERESYTTPCQWGPSLTVRVTLCHCATVPVSLPAWETSDLLSASQHSSVAECWYNSESATASCITSWYQLAVTLHAWSLLHCRH